MPNYFSGPKKIIESQPKDAVLTHKETRSAELKVLMEKIEAQFGGFGHIPIKSDYWDYKRELARLNDATP
jgi:hypothetical protein